MVTAFIDAAGEHQLTQLCCNTDAYCRRLRQGTLCSSNDDELLRHFLAVRARFITAQAKTFHCLK